jgi:hypothetical protein
MQKIPVIGDHFVKEIPPEDNVRQMFEPCLRTVLTLLLSHFDVVAFSA